MRLIEAQELLKLEGNGLLLSLHLGLIFRNYAFFQEGYDVTFLIGKASTLAASFVCLCDVAIGSCFGVLPWKRG